MSFYTHKFKEVVLQLLFSIEMGQSLEKDLLPFLMKEVAVSKKNVREAYKLAYAIFEMKDVLNEKVAKTSKAYELERIGRVEQNVLRLALYEYFVDKQNPRELIITEALRLTRKFSTKEAATFVNAILDAATLEETDDRNTPISPQEEPALI